MHQSRGEVAAPEAHSGSTPQQLYAQHRVIVLAEATLITQLVVLFSALSTTCDTLPEVRYFALVVEPLTVAYLLRAWVRRSPIADVCRGLWKINALSWALIIGLWAIDMTYTALHPPCSLDPSLF